MKKYLAIILLFLSCSNESPTSSENDIFINNKAVFDLELNTWSPDWIDGWSIRGSSLIVYVQTAKFSQNRSDKIYDVDKFLHRGIILYQFVSDTIVILGIGKGKIADGFDRAKNIVYPNDTYKHVSRIDSVWTINDSGIYYTNFWYKGELNSVEMIQINKTNSLMGKKLNR